MDALFYRTGVSGILEPLLILGTGCPWNSNCDDEALNFSRRRAAHFFLDGCRGSGEVEIQSSGNDAHCGQHARAKGCGDEVSRRETLTSTLIVDRRICREFSL